MADDLGYGDLSCYGAPDIQTPSIDSLAREGVRLTDYYASAPVCTPTRCALMTGRYQQRVPNLEWAIYPGVKTVGLPRSEMTIAAMLKKVGYRTGIFGKWHLGYREQNHPLRHGFDEFFGILSGNVDHFRHKESNQEHDLYLNQEEFHTEGYLTDLITDRAVDFIRRNRDSHFFLYVPYNAPHFPIQSPDDEDVEISRENWNRGGDRADYAGMVEAIDAGVGRILKALKETDLDEDTLIIFCSDNGGERLGRNDPLSGGKGSLKEGGIRVPCILRWLRVLPQGQESRQTAITMDLSVMLLNAAGVRPDRHLDGFNLFPVLCGEKRNLERTFCWRAQHRSEKAARWGDWKWYQKDGRDHLYYLPEDIAEQNNLVERNIDIVHGIKTIYRDWEQAMPFTQELFGMELNQLNPPTY